MPPLPPVVPELLLELLPPAPELLELPLGLVVLALVVSVVSSEPHAIQVASRPAPKRKVSLCMGSVYAMRAACSS
jgi:hypothetical protein